MRGGGLRRGVSRVPRLAWPRSPPLAAPGPSHAGSCRGLVGCLLGAVFATPAPSAPALTPPPTNLRRSRPTEREVLMTSVGGYKSMRWESSHGHQLPCLDPSEHEENAQCVVCMANVEDRGDADVLLMECGHWVCTDEDCRPRRNLKGRARAPHQNSRTPVVHSARSVRAHTCPPAWSFVPEASRCGTGR